MKGRTLLKARSREAVGEVKGDVEVKTQVSRKLLVSITVMNILYELERESACKCWPKALQHNVKVTETQESRQNSIC